jgi:hypothetical protein
MNIFTDTSMDDLGPIEKCRKAITHTLNRIHSHPGIGYYMGLGSETFSLLTEAFAGFGDARVETVRHTYAPNRPENPALDEDLKRDAVEQAMENWTPPQADYLEAIESMSIPSRLEILEDLQRTFCFKCGGKVPVKPCGCSLAGMRRQHRREVA